MRIAIVGSGISGLASAWLLSRRHEVTLFEADHRLGGHTHTHDVTCAGETYPVDSGFIVFNHAHYPLLTRLFDELGIDSQPTTMSFSVHSDLSGIEYNATSIRGLFSRPRNATSPRFWRMLADLVRFYRIAPLLLEQPGPGPSLGEFLAEHRFGPGFTDDHLVPMASALWSSPPRHVLEFPAQYLVRFMANHQMLQLTQRPPWLVVRGGSRRYVEAMQSRWDVTVRTATPVHAVRRDAQGVELDLDGSRERFDQVVLACHGDHALDLLADATSVEREVLGAFTYQSNDTVLHTDIRLLPRRRSAWAAWNAHVPGDPHAPCTVSYCMNLLQSLPAPETFIVSLNPFRDIDPSRVLARMHYRHPLYTAGRVAAHSRKHEIQGRHRTWFAGAYWGWGFHEDGMRSAVELAAGLGVPWPAVQPTEWRLAPAPCFKEAGA